MSLRDVERAMNVMVWFYNHRNALHPVMDDDTDEDNDDDDDDDDNDDNDDDSDVEYSKDELEQVTQF